MSDNAYDTSSKFQYEVYVKQGYLDKQLTYYDNGHILLYQIERITLQI
ncbi:hypothetical protein [Xenorhabdus sp. KJ12.1]|nr:hypothetical protein [Xenorhabdus sp. KJ12.1]